jgi:glyoxylase-like metal-dependent hydrolase (beta-lactamase superfamily II)
MRELRTTDFERGITAIDTGYHRPYFDASHLIVDAGRAVFVDTGTTHSVPLLMAALKRKGLAPKDVDCVLLTHVHLDHAGGAGELMRLLPNAICIVHPRGARHMIDPEKLVAGTRAVYGDEAFERLYGEVPGIPPERVRESTDGMEVRLGNRSLTLFDTPGHAKHHYCIHDSASRSVFTGDTFGVSYRELDTAKGAFILPATTPVQFDPEAYHDSIDRILSWKPEACFLTHYSRVAELDRLAADLHEEIEHFVEITVSCAESDDRSSDIEERLFEHQVKRLADHGVPDPEKAAEEVLGMDLELDARGLAIWLEKNAG